MTTPILPDLADVSTFGGFKLDGDAVIDPQSEMSAADWNRVIAQLAALGFPVPKAVVFVGNPGGVPSVTGFLSVWGAGPAGTPTVAPVSGSYVVTFPTTVSDFQDPPETHTLGLRGGLAIPIDPAAMYGAVTACGATTLTCSFYTPSGGATKFAPARFFVVVW